MKIFSSSRCISLTLQPFTALFESEKESFFTENTVWDKDFMFEVWTAHELKASNAGFGPANLLTGMCRFIKSLVG